MLLLILGLIMVGFIVLAKITNVLDLDTMWLEAYMFIGFIIGVIACIGLWHNTTKLIDNKTIDNKIAIYQEENKKLEEKIETTVKGYMDFENDTYKELKTESYINLVNLYPELKSDKLIQEQIKTYQKNSEEIKELKVKKAKSTVYKWWIYFGK